MRLREALASVLHLAIVFFFIFLSFISFIIAAYPLWREDLLQMLAPSKPFYWAGILNGLISCLLIRGFYYIGRGRYLKIKMDPHSMAIEKKLLEQAVFDFFQTHSKGEIRLIDIGIISQKRLDILVEMPAVSMKKRKELLREIHSPLLLLFQRRFGFCKSLSLTLCEQPT